MRNLIPGIFVIALLVLAIPVRAQNLTQDWVEEQIRQIAGYAGVCHPHQSPDICNGHVIRLYANLAGDLTKEVLGLCAKKSKGARSCEENVSRLTEASDSAIIAAITLQAQLNGDSPTPNGMSRALLSKYIGLRGQVEALKALLPK